MSRCRAAYFEWFWSQRGQNFALVLLQRPTYVKMLHKWWFLTITILWWHFSKYFVSPQVSCSNQVFFFSQNMHFHIFLCFFIFCKRGWGRERSGFKVGGGSPLPGWPSVLLSSILCRFLLPQKTCPTSKKLALSFAGGCVMTRNSTTHHKTSMSWHGVSGVEGSLHHAQYPCCDQKTETRYELSTFDVSEDRVTSCPFFEVEKWITGFARLINTTG